MYNENELRKFTSAKAWTVRAYLLYKALASLQSQISRYEQFTFFLFVGVKSIAHNTNTDQQMETQFKVAICLVTYNQERYIRQAIDSVLAQQTAIPYTLFIGDDSSIDETPVIIEEYVLRYPEKVIHLRTPQNQGIVGNTTNVFRHIFKDKIYKYVALLDGDDYWNDPLKLHKQVLFLEERPNFAFVFSRMGTCGTNGENYSASKPRNIGNGGDWFPRLMHIGINNGTVMHRVAFLKNIDWDKILSWNLLSCDYATNVFMAAQGYVGFIDEEMGVWRRGGGTVSSPTDEKKLLRYFDHECRQGLYLAKEFPNTPYANFTQIQADEHMNNQIMIYAIFMKNYHLFTCVDWNKLHKEMPWWGKTKITFILYVYIIKKATTLINILKGKIYNTIHSKY